MKSSNTKILALVMAGGEGSRLHPLTSEHSKPSLPFGGRYRIVDFVLSNLINSGIHSIYLLVQYKSQSLIEHVRKAWSISPTLLSQFVTVVPPQMLQGAEWFQGTANAVYQNINLIEEYDPDLILIFSADHIYRMDVRQMVHRHQAKQADVSLAALPVPLNEAVNFGVLVTDEDQRVLEFQEKLQQPTPMPDDPDRAYASMGNYIFNADVLLEALQEGQARGETDFGYHLLPRLLKTHRLYAYDFQENQIPGIRSYEEASYWRDVGTLDAYFDAHRDLLGSQPRLDLFNAKWPIYSSNYQGPATRIIDCTIDNSVVAGGNNLHGATVRDSIIRREVVLEPDVELEECLIMDYVRIKRGARLRRTIVSRYNVLEAHHCVGYEPEQDRRRYVVSPGGVVVIPSGKISQAKRAFSESD
jgi:glucose-1-phosphate adenylyltransferase